MSLLDQTGGDSASLAPSSGAMSNNGSDRGRSPHSQSNLLLPEAGRDRNSSPSRQPTSAEIDAVIAAAMANAPPAPPEQHENMSRSVTPLMTNLLPAAVGADGRVNLFVGNLPYRVRWQDLKDLFRKAGTVLRADVSLGPDNRSRGYGTVLMGSREDAARAIDRFNGFTWQTRTLEVRPDRLPPEYEPQPHTLNHHVHPRPPLYTYHNMSGSSHQSFSHAAHMPPNQGPPWLPGQVPLQRPPSSHGMLGSGSMPGQGQLGMMGGPYPPHMGMPGRSPIPQSHSPHPMPGSLNMSHGSSEHVMQVPPPGASPLAGSLSYGPQGHADLVRRESVVSNGSGLTSETGNMGPLRNLSPALVPGTITRSRSDAGLNMGGASPSRLEQLPGQLGSHRGSVGHLPSGLFSKGLTPTTTGGQSSDAGASIPGPQINGSGIPTAAGVTIAMEGLSHQAQHMGPPNTLHDRVVFVSNLPLSMQWQELKDLLRPAGLIIRADVATRSDGRPRGFGTALFASETDAAKAVTMFNEREVAGNRIKVLLERDIVPESGRQSRANSATSLTPEGQSESAGSREGGSQGSSDAPRLPWALQTSLPSNTQATPRRGGPIGSEYTQQATPQQSHRPHHPGPISMPAFPGLDSPGFNNPLSPLQTRNLPPMTPSMPGFVFNAYPETPPLHPHFMSPGLGPFSPGIPVTSPGGFQYNPFLNPAPGGPVNRYPQAGSAALGTPTTTAFPSNPVHGYGAPGAIGGPGGDTSHQSLLQAVGDYFPPTSTGEPGSPTPRVPSRQNNSNQNPLNAKDRLASTTSVPASDSIDPLETSLADLSLEANAASSDGPATPMASKKTALPRTSQEGLSPTQTEVNGSNSRGSPFQPSSRASLDGLRPHLGHLGFGWDSNNGERRASFGDIASGKRASNE